MFKQNDVYFILSLLSLGLSAFFLLLALYILPAVWLGWIYPLSNFIYSLNDWIEYIFIISDTAASWVMVDLFFILFLFFSCCTYFYSYKAKNDLHRAALHVSDDEQALLSYRDKQERRDTVLSIIKMVLIIGLVFIVARIMHYTISLTTIE